MTKSNYSADDIQVLEGGQAVRKRPGMYIGSTGIVGLKHLVFEVVSNSVDQVLSGRATSVRIVVHDDDSVEVIDDGPGLDLAKELVRNYFTKLHSQGTADGHTPHVHLNPFGLGLAVVNFLSSRFVVQTRFEGRSMSCTWTDGASKATLVENDDHLFTGTSVRFWPDETIFDTTTLPAGCLDQRVREFNALIPELDLALSHRGSPGTWQEGLAALLDDHIGPQGVRFAPKFMSVCDERDESGPIELRLCIRPVGDDYNGVGIITYCNFQLALDEGAFVQTIKRGVRDVLRNLAPAGAPETGDAAARLAMIASITMMAPQWSGPTRRKLDDPRATKVASQLVESQLRELIESSAPLRELLTTGSIS